jgi:hypothetical protein
LPMKPADQEFFSSREIISPGFAWRPVFDFS